jgi:predicted permease
MGTTRAWLSRLGGLFGKQERDRELAAELESHLQFHIDDNVRAGMSQNEARRQALLKLGSVEATKEAYRERRGVPLLEQTWQDVKFGVRMLLKNPAFTVVGLLALTLGIGANTALFSVVYGVLLRPLPYREGHRLVVLEQPAPRVGIENAAFSVREINDYRARTHNFEQLEEYHGMNFILLGPKPDRVRTGVVSHGFFGMLGVKPLLGRDFGAADDEPGAPAVLILSNQYWHTMFGGDPSVIGQTVKLNDKLHTIVGVLPAIPQYPRDNDVYMPVAACPFRMNQMHLEQRSMRMMGLFGRLKSGVPLATADAEVRGIAAGFVKDYPSDYRGNTGFTARASLLQQQLTQKAGPMLWLLLGTTAVVLLICCTNVANLALARMMRREREFAVRAALGASRGRLARQMITESILLALGGGALGILLASATLDLLISFVGRYTSRAAGVELSGPVLLFNVAVSVGTGLVFGLLPALSLRRDPSSTMQATATATTEARHRHRMRSVLIVAQVALSFVLLSGAGLMLRTLLKLERVQAGYNSDRVLAARLPSNFTKYSTSDDYRKFENNILRELQPLPGVTHAALTSAAPLDTSSRPSRVGFIIEGRAVDPNATQPVVNVMTVTPGAFKVLEIPLVRGRFLSDGDGPKSPEVTVVSESFVRHFFPKEDPLGKRVSGDAGRTWAKIVGIVGDVRQFGLEQAPMDTLYVAEQQSPGTGVVLLRTQADPWSVVNMLRAAVARVDGEQPVVDIKTLDELRDESLAATRLTAMLLALFGLIALVIAATGLAGVTSFLVSQRTREIGIRMALGAQVRQVLGLVLSHGLKLIAVGTVLGVALSFASGRALRNLLFEIRPMDLPSLIAVAATLIGVSLVASYLPARRATKVQPTVALRCD